MAKPKTLREQQHEFTRELIFQALADVVLEEGVHAFTVQRVAERAGISPRTIYRHFPTRQVLLDALGEWGAEEEEQAGGGLPETADGFAELTRSLFRGWDAYEAMVRAFAIMRVTANLQPRERRERVQRVDRLIYDWAPDAPQQYRDQARHVIRALSGTVTWTQMRTDLGISGAEAGDAVGYAIDLVLADLKRRSDEAAAAMAEEAGAGGHDADDS
jgi:AcrR family transcriptional regulator